MGMAGGSRAGTEVVHYLEAGPMRVACTTGVQRPLGPQHVLCDFVPCRAWQASMVARKMGSSAWKMDLVSKDGRSTNDTGCPRPNARCAGIGPDRKPAAAEDLDEDTMRPSATLRANGSPFVFLSRLPA